MRHLVPLLACLSAGLSGTLAAQDAELGGPRSVGMGGTGVADVDSTHVQYLNPAALGFMWSGDEEADRRLGRKKVGWTMVSASAGALIAGDLAERLGNLAGVDYGDIGSDDDLSEEEVQDLVTIAGNFVGLDQPGNGLLVQAGLSSQVRIGRIAVGAAAWGQAAGRVDTLDLVNFGLEFPSVNALSDELDRLALLIPGNPSGDNLSNAQMDALVDAGLSQEAVDYLDYQIGEQLAAGTISSSQINGAVDLLLAMVEATDNGDLIEGNTTSLTLRGLGVFEIPISYGHAITPELSIGLTGKIMRGRVYGTTILVFDEDNDEVLDRVRDGHRESTTFGIDVAALYRMPWLQIGLVGRNLNRPTFKGFTTEDGVQIADVKLDPQLRLGAAAFPTGWITVAAELDLLKTDTLLHGYQRQYLGLGIEMELLRTLALRGGLRKNIAESDEAAVASLGLGLDLWALRLDLAAAIGLGRAEWDGTRYPEQGQVALALAIDF